MTTSASNEMGRERARLNFANAVGERFAFLGEYGFMEIESLPTIVRYRKDGLEANVYHTRQSFEVGFEMVRDGVRYSLSELIRASNPQEGLQHRNYAATTVEGIAQALARLEGLVKHYCDLALQNDPAFFAMLAELEKAWSEGYALDVLARQLRPKAEVAFRAGDYRQAAELYERIRPRLSGTELKKLALAKERARR